MKAIKDLEKKISQLSPQLIDQLEQYIDFLVSKKDEDGSGNLKQDWAGKLKDQKYTSIELQKKSLNWR
jgi:hypothetical protein